MGKTPASSVAPITKPKEAAHTVANPAPSSSAPKVVLASAKQQLRTESRLDAEMREVKEQVEKKKKQMQVQRGLEKEQEVEAVKAEKRASELRGKANKLEKEAQV